MNGVRRVASRSPHELWTRAMQRGLALGERGRLVLGAPTTDVRSAHAMRSAGTIRPFWPGIDDLAGTAVALQTSAPAEVRALLERAEQVERGKVEMMGLGWLDLGRIPNWHREPVSGRIAPARHWSTIPYLDPSQVGDHKLLWEFNRHQQWVTLGQAFALTGDVRWRAAWEAQLSSWLDQNPPTVGMNWSSSLEVAYRGISWCWASRLFGDALSPALDARMRESVEAHGRHVRRYLSTYFSPNTHLTGEALGLFYLGTTFADLPDAARWRTLGAGILESELGRQLLPDGVYFEQATQYHRYTAEIYLHYLVLAERAGETVSPAVRRAVHRLFDVLLALHRDDGSMPLLGDDDGGRLVQLDGGKPHALRGLLSAGAIVLERSDLAHAGAHDDAMALWLFGADARRTLERLRASAWLPESANAFRAAGLFVMRDDAGSGGLGHAVIDAGPHGALSYGHSHADALAVELYAGGGPLFVDAGTATYVGDARNAFRSTASHNTVEVDGVGICEPGTAFRWKSVTDGQLDGWVHADGLSWFVGHHDGYRVLPDPATHARSVTHPTAGVWVVSDRLRSAGSHDVVLRWHCDPSVRPVVRAPAGALHLVDLHREGQLVATLLMCGEDASVRVEQGQVSPQFGQVQDASVITLRARTAGDATLSSVVLDWLALPAASVSVVMGGQRLMLARAGESASDGATPAATSALRPTHVLQIGQALESEHGPFHVVADAVCAELLDGVTRRVAATGVVRVSGEAEVIAADASPGGWFVAARQQSPEWQCASGFFTSNAT